MVSGSLKNIIYTSLVKIVNYNLIFYIILIGASEQGSNKSATIEMYAPSSYNETVTGETLSSVSEKSESYSDSNAEYAVSFVSYVFFCIGSYVITN